MGHPFLKIVAVAAVCVATTAFATTVYEHNGSGSFSYTSGSEYGDEVLLRSGPDRVITGFSFKYAANYAQASGLTFKIYAQNGPKIGGFNSPGTLLDSRTLDVVNNGAVVKIDYGVDWANIIPDRLTYTVFFSGLTPGRTAGLIAPGGSPVIGMSGNDFWEKTGTGANDWALKTFQGGPSANFIATITAVPEPGTVALMVAGLGLVLVAARRK